MAGVLSSSQPLVISPVVFLHNSIHEVHSNSSINHDNLYQHVLLYTHTDGLLAKLLTSDSYQSQAQDSDVSTCIRAQDSGLIMLHGHWRALCFKIQEERTRPDHRLELPLEPKLLIIEMIHDLINDEGHESVV